MLPSRWRLAAYALTVLLGCLVALPTVLPPAARSALPAWLAEHQVKLGLDLRGGSHLVLGVDEPALQRELSDSLLETARQVLREGGIRGAMLHPADGAIAIRLASPQQAQEAQRLLAGADLLAVSGPDGALRPDLELADPSSLRLRMTPQQVEARRAAAVAQSLEIVRRRIDEVGLSEPSIQRLGPDRIMVQLPGVQDPAELRQLLGSTAKLGFHRVAGVRAAGPGQVSLPMAEGGGTLVVDRRPMLQGDRLADAGAGPDPQTRQPAVTFRLDRAGASRFAEISRQELGRPFAIVLDGKVLSAPVIREPILGGSGQITGGFTMAEAASLAAMLRAGALPVPLQVVEERVVGPDLGGDAIQAATAAGLIGFGLVAAVMIGLYGGWGAVATAALATNVALTLGGLSLLGATLTLPGLAGIILGLGLAVDANVLINERIREETRNGRGAAAALHAGFDRAYRTIVDANVTTLIATLLLFAFGSGPVRGFALTMALGIGISMFTAVALVKAAMGGWLRLRRPKRFEIRPLWGARRLFALPRIGFMRARHAGLAVSLALSLASVALFVQPGLNYGIDFRGGILIEARTQGPAGLAALRGGLDGLALGDVSLQEFGAADRVLVRIERQPGGEAAQTQAVDRARAAIVAAQPGTRFERVEVVGPRVSAELAQTGILAVALAALAMFAYVWLRFEWPFAIGALATMALDVTKVAGFIALTGLDFDLAAVAALLTLIGYSVNDKVVVYDRIRENLRLYKAMPLRELIDLSINQTLGRSLYTSATALVAMLPLAIWGGSAVQSFAVPMVAGIVVAASSSVFIAAPILLLLGDWRQRRRARLAAAAELQGPALPEADAAGRA